MKIFVTGGTGFIGQHLCNRLVKDGHQVVALIRSPEKARSLPEGIEYNKGDLSLFSNPDLVLPECDTVVHLAAVVAGKNDAEYGKINHEAVVSFIECLERQTWTPKQFVFASSLAAGGPSLPDEPLTEEMEPAPIDSYGKAKIKAEWYLEGVSFPTTSFRPSIVLGPLDGATFTLYKMAKLGIGFRPTGPKQPVSFIDVMDLVDSIVKMCEQPDPQGEHRVYYVSYTEHTESVVLFEEMGKAFNKSVFLVPIPRPLLKTLSVVASAASQIIPFKNQLDAKQYRQITARAFLCSSDKLQNELGWSPQINLQESIRLSIEGYQKEGWL